MSYITAHVLDATAGVPARGVEIQLLTPDGEQLATGITDDDGRVGDLGPETLEPGAYRVTFGTGDYFTARGQQSFHPVVTVDFTVQAGEKHYHIPLLLSPFAYSTYRGS
ncbi:hydroxyisourate hydrolase [Nesterenkonia xinjiangensis]|uniref:5-hydroxyisourate hydrolase n=1 Tax=Nesterenkonia xinjiangensis TaxID=225327 RepID=A0A7Z0GKK7_9MICC|nr:hydroxyisourate hydrolase [Nesterenkonia xinjiangensis]NYJ77652.1 5-hydroxyisourate hydrolase [Nesterenkonia xinjiangensis]